MGANRQGEKKKQGRRSESGREESMRKLKGPRGAGKLRTRGAGGCNKREARKG